MWVCAVRGDLAYSVKELARMVSGPTVNDWKAMQRVLRYLRGSSSLALHLEPERDLPVREVRITAYSDSDGPGVCERADRPVAGS